MMTSRTLANQEGSVLPETITTNQRHKRNMSIKPLQNMSISSIGDSKRVAVFPTTTFPKPLACYYRFPLKIKNQL